MEKGRSFLEKSWKLEEGKASLEKSREFKRDFVPLSKLSPSS